MEEEKSVREIKIFKHKLHEWVHEYHNFTIDYWLLTIDYWNLTIKVLIQELRELRIPTEIECFKNRK